MSKIYKLTPCLKDYLWGGNKLKKYGKQTDGEIIAESWELSFTKGGEAEVDGVKLPEFFSRAAWGTNASRFEFFPVLTKFIDARDKLSVQVHPSDEYALKYEGQYGKTEMWYIVEAEEGAGIYIGFNREITKEELVNAVSNGTVEGLLSFVPVKAGEVYFIPAGTVHAIGAGTLIYEIQQNSNLTYRLYDYMRRDKDGNLRELHVDKAMAVITLDKYNPPPCDGKNAALIGECRYFKAQKYKLKVTNKQFYVGDGSFLTVTCTAGEGSIEGERISRGDTYFIPAGKGKIDVVTDREIELITVEI